MSRHYTEKNEYPILNSRYSTLHLKQYLDEKDIKYLEKLLKNKNPKNKSEEELLKLWDCDFIELYSFTDRIKSNIKKIGKVEILTENKETVVANVLFTSKDKYYEGNDKFIASGKFNRKRLEYTLSTTPGGIHLTYVDAEKLWKAVNDKAGK